MGDNIPLFYMDLTYSQYLILSTLVEDDLNNFNLGNINLNDIMRSYYDDLNSIKYQVDIKLKELREPKECDTKGSVPYTLDSYNAQQL